MKRFKKLLSLFLTIAILLSTCSIGITVSATDTGTNITEETPLKIEVEADTKSPSLYSVVGFTVKITNTGDEELKNVTAQTVFDDLSPVSKRKSETNKEVETLKSGESFSYTYKATLNIDNSDLNFFNKIILWFVRLFNSGYTVENASIDDGRIVVKNITEFSFGKVVAENVVDVGYNKPSQNQDNEISTSVQLELLNMKKINDGKIPDITMNLGVPSFISGKFSDTKVVDIVSAIASLNDIKNLMKIKDAENEFVEKNHSTTQYKLQQVYNNVPVYGNILTITTDNDGNIESLNGHYTPNLNINTTPIITEEDAVKELVNNGYSVINSQELVIYAVSGYNPKLVYKIRCGGMVDVFVSATDGHIVSSSGGRKTLSSLGVDLSGNIREFQTYKKDDSLFLLKDNIRGITVFNDNNLTTPEELDNLKEYEDYLQHATIIASVNDTWAPEAVQAMYLAKSAYDFYNNTVTTSAFNNKKLSIINVVINYSQNYLNAFSDTDVNNLTTTYLCIGDGENYLNAHDVFYHEFTHSVIRATCNLEYLNEAGAINEAYADIIGSLIEGKDDMGAWLLGEDAITGGVRNLQSPSSFSQPEKINDKYMHSFCYEEHNHYDADCDMGGVHCNSGIINKAAYLMWQYGISDKTQLAQLFVTSLEYMNENSNFDDCRAAILHSAKKMNMSSYKIDIIKKAFNEVGITNGDITYINGTVIDEETGKPIPNVFVVAKYTDIDGYVTYTNNNGEYELVLPKNGIYEFEFYHDDYEPQYDSRYATGEDIELNVSMNSKDSSDISDKYIFSNTVLDETTEKPISEVTVEVTIEGDSFTNVITTATTDENGRFTVELPEGNYVFSLSHDDYQSSIVPVTVNPETADGIMYLSPMDNAGNEDDNRTVVDSGDCGADGDNVKWTLYDDGELVISGSGGMQTYIKSYDVPWFSYSSSIRTVNIGEYITMIDDNSFNCCNYLTNISVDKNNQCYSNDTYGMLYNRDKTVLLKCPQDVKISSYHISDTVTSIGDNAFYWCANLKKIYLSNNLISIGNRAFYGCTGITDIEICDKVIDIGYQAFLSCYSLSNVTISSSVTSIGYNAFMSCPSLSNITVDKTNQYYSSDAHGVLYNKDKSELIQYPIGNNNTEYNIPENVTNIAMYAFDGCNYLIHITIPDSVLSIGQGAFRGCTSLINIEIPDSITYIPYNAFENCSSLTSVSIPNSVTDIGGHAFYGTILSDVYYNGSEEEWNSIAINAYNTPIDNATIHYNC